MKKQKMLKLTAYLSDPSAENSFSAPVTHSGEISVVFRGKNVSIHGFDGSAWTTIYTWNSLDPQYQMNNTYQSYYLKSLTGSEETLNVSFFSTGKYQGSTPQIAGIDRATKLHDIEEVPIYTSSDENKMLTIMSNGSLAWLLANESFVIPPEAGGVFTPSGVGTFLEELTLGGSGVVTDGVLTTNTTNPSYYQRSMMPPVSTTATTAVFSMWFNPTQAKMGLYSDMHVASQVTFGLRMFNTGLLHISTPIGTTNGVSLATPLTLNEWHHALVTVETSVAYASTSSKSMTVKLFIDGQEVYTNTGNSSTKRIRAYTGISTSVKHHIGAQNYNGQMDYKGVGQFDFIEWVDDVTLSDAQILAMYNGGTRGWSVADGNAYVAPVAGPSYPVVNSMITDSSRFSTYYGATITPEDTLKLGSHHSSMLKTTVSSADNRIQEDTTITMWVKSSSTQNEASILRFGQWSSGDLAKGVYISMSTRLGRAKTVAGNAIMSSYSNGYFVVKTNSSSHNGSSAWGYKTYFALPTNIRDGEWHQLVFQFLNVGAGVGPGTAKVYVDGVKINDSFRDNGNIEQDANGLQVLTHNPIDTAGAGWLTLGAGFGVNSEFGGFTIEEQVLTEEQIESKYADDESNYTP